MIICQDIENRTIHLPATSVSHWVEEMGGGLCVYARGGPPIWVKDKAAVLAQLEAAGLVPDTRVTPAFSPPPEMPEIASRPPVGTVARQKGKQL